MTEVEQDCPECKKGAPDWMITFSDLMTLLLTFFVLLLSVSVIDDPKFESASESIRESFEGIHIMGEPQRDLQIIEIFDRANEKIQVKESDDKNKDLTSTKDKESDFKEKNKIKMAQIIEEIVQDELTREVDFGIAEVENKQDRVLIRFPAEATFESGSAEIKPLMKPVFQKLAESLENLNVKAVINGHTDDVPIKTAQFRSNWDLSSARAASVAMAFQENSDFSTSELEILGHADGDPLVPNDSPENREKNRRIELYIEPYDPDFSKDIFNTVIEETMPNFFADTSATEASKPKTSEEKDAEVQEKKKSWVDKTIDRIRKFGEKEEKK